MKNKTNSRVWRSSIVAHSKDFSWGTLVDKFSVVEGFIFEITWHSTFTCNCVVPENIHTPPQPTEDHCKFRGGGGFKRSYFRGVGGVHGKLLFQRVMNHEQNTESNVQSIVRTKTSVRCYETKISKKMWWHESAFVPLPCSILRRPGYLASKITSAIVTMFTKPSALACVSEVFGP